MLVLVPAVPHSPGVGPQAKPLVTDGSWMDLFWQLLKNGVVLGLLYGLFAYGLSLIIAVTRVFHFAHGFTLAFSALLFWNLYESAGMPFVVAAPLTIAAAAAVGVASEAWIYGPIRNRGGSEMVILVASLLLLVLGQNLAVLHWGASVKVVTKVRPFLDWGISVGTVSIRGWDVAVFVTALLGFALLYVLLTKTQLGLRLRAVGDNPERAASLGINLKHSYRLVFAIGSGLAAVPALLLASRNPILPAMGFEVLVLAFVAIVVGGIGSMPGALLGGLVVGVTEQLAVLYLPTEWGQFVLFALLFGFIIVKPYGLLPAKSGT